MAIANILPTNQNTLERIFLVSCTDDASREFGQKSHFFGKHYALMQAD